MHAAGMVGRGPLANDREGECGFGGGLLARRVGLSFGLIGVRTPTLMISADSSARESHSGSGRSRAPVVMIGRGVHCSWSENSHSWPDRSLGQWDRYTALYSSSVADLDAHSMIGRGPWTGLLAGCVDRNELLAGNQVQFGGDGRVGSLSLIKQDRSTFPIQVRPASPKTRAKAETPSVGYVSNPRIRFPIVDHSKDDPPGAKGATL
ncbi:hypothetical protein BDK51DRAFT_41510 [Blyttiomyces helicus]|uniref:Uncharacterized protein n=1 Tax=Blyttiomyces helicus TaxID=388810 RepID=A0A4P9WKP5_9FUNG|nr:hypothetical protein BDK51DRAFT_41510 [Blyttiomyces helicus]|eukprot:RKO92593.1 hypothetical protein BDK51DRAFT_41510 [Blyttiomyces helicus]